MTSILYICVKLRLGSDVCHFWASVPSCEQGTLMMVSVSLIGCRSITATSSDSAAAFSQSTLFYWYWWAESQSWICSSSHLLFFHFHRPSFFLLSSLFFFFLPSVSVPQFLPSFLPYVLIPLTGNWQLLNLKHLVNSAWTIKVLLLMVLWVESRQVGIHLVKVPC